MNKKFYIVGAGDSSGIDFIKKENEYVIAADGGLETLKKLGIEPDIVMGDFDSLGYVPQGDNVTQYKVEKDDTDMMLAVERALEEQCDSIEIFGGTGGRIDHTFANIQTMLYASKKGVSVKMTDACNEYYVITNEQIMLKGKPEGNLSVFAIGGTAYGVSVQGAKYIANKMNLTPDNPTAVSNSYIGKDVTISVEKGSLLIVTS